MKPGSGPKGGEFWRLGGPKEVNLRGPEGIGVWVLALVHAWDSI